MQPLLDKPENYYNGPEITSLWVLRCQNPSFRGQIKSSNVGEKLKLWIWVDYFGNGCVFEESSPLQVQYSLPARY